MKTPGEYSVDEVCIWLNAIGLGAKIAGFRENAVDGNMLVSLAFDDLTADLGLTNLQAKKLVRDLETSKQMASGGDGGGNNAAALEKAANASLKEENEKLRNRVVELTQENNALRAQISPPPVPVPAAAPAPTPTPTRVGHPVVREGARGAVRGATLGAIGGAIAGDAGKGAKIGAAIGGTRGGMRGLRARRVGMF
jgi:hypothetical protein